MSAKGMLFKGMCFAAAAAFFVCLSSCRQKSPKPPTPQTPEQKQTQEQTPQQVRKETAPAENPKNYIGAETKEQHDERMAWWRQSRFGMFIHWGLYAVPAGQWKDSTNHAEWILTTAQIPVDEYEKFGPQFNPVKFNADEWVKMAKQAGMKYIVITSKHHDGFCLFDSKQTNYDIMDATPFKRDIMKELSEACRKQGITMCWYHSIMDWHHPDYLPRRDWEKRPAEGADLSRYVKYMKGQLAELVGNYGKIGVLWFDGEWENTWTPDLGDDLYNYVRALQPDIIINNRVSKGRAGMAGTFDPLKFAGDFGTPEQEIPATGLGYDWETCMTMNDHWGYNSHDNNWKSTEDLIRKLIDIASKGGNFLLNIGPKPDGTFPEQSVQRLAGIGNWMKVNGESIYGTGPSLFSDLQWGRCTTKPGKLYLHVFDWPKDGRLVVAGLLTKAESVYLLEKPDTKLNVEYQTGAAVVSVPQEVPDPVATVVVMEFKTKPEVVQTPEITADNDQFCGKCQVKMTSNLENVKICYTLDGSAPAAGSVQYEKPVTISDSTTVKCQIFRDDKAISGVAQRSFTRVEPRAAEVVAGLEPGLEFEYYHGTWDKLPDFGALTPVASGIIADFDISGKKQPENLGFRFRGYAKVPTDGMYVFYVASDDGSRLWIADKLVVDNDGLHATEEKSGDIALAAGVHPIRAEFFQKSGGIAFEVAYAGPNMEKKKIPPSALSHK